jgi:predicted transcriptional regulator
MKLPCEIVIIDILPVIRKELSVELVDVHKFSKADVARMFDVSGTAISQYVHGARGKSAMIEGCPQYSVLMDEISLSAKRIAEKKSVVIDELCGLCDTVKRIGLLDHVYENGIWKAPLIKCAECPRKDLC